MNNEKLENNTMLYKVLVHASVCIFILILPVLLSLHNNFQFAFILEHSWIPTFFYSGNRTLVFITCSNMPGQG